jgi:hypothetical protein
MGWYRLMCCRSAGMFPLSSSLVLCFATRTEVKDTSAVDYMGVVCPPPVCSSLFG